MQKCSKCGFVVYNPTIKCPRCFEAGTMVLVKELPKSTLLIPVENKTYGNRISTGFSNLDHLLNGGMAPGCVHFLPADSGIGKTTLLFQIAVYLVSIGLKVFFFTGEERKDQIEDRARRLGLIENNPIFFYKKNIREIGDIVRKELPDVIIVDSLQATLGSQMKNVSREAQTSVMLQLMVLSESHNICTLVIGQVRKDKQPYGPKALEHYSEVMIIGQRGINDELILTTPYKNRLGPTGRRAIFRMTEKGLVEKDEKEIGYILRHTTPIKSGIASFIIDSSNGPMVDEITAIQHDRENILLVGGSHNQAEFLTIVIQRFFSDFQPSCIIRANQSLKLPKSADLAIIMAALSQFFRKPIPHNVAFTSSVDARGFLLSVPNIANKVQNAKNQGYTRVFSALPIGSQIATWETASTIKDVWEKLFS